MEKTDIKEITMIFLKDTPIEEELNKAYSVFEKAQVAALTLNNIGEPEDLTLTRIGTVLSLNLFGIFLGGKKPAELTKEDWENITKEVLDKAVLTEDQDYSIYVFDLYADYIDVSVKALQSKTENEKLLQNIDKISSLSEELRQNKELLIDGHITETDYIEKCLWVSLDAMIKCMAAYISCYTGDDIGYLIQAASSYTFEYGRLKLYQREQALINEYIQNQYILDDQLQVKLNAYKKELEEEAEQFNLLLEKAFDGDFRKTLMGSVELARATGVKEEEILHTTDEIDAFFLE